MAIPVLYAEGMTDATAAPRRLTAKGQATKERILRVAADLILKHGVGGTGVEDVRRAAGVSGSQMTHYFQDKRSLINDVIAWQLATTLTEHSDPVLHGFDSFAAFDLWARVIVERQRERACRGGCTFGSLAGQLVESDEATRADLAEGFDRWLTIIRAGLLAMRERGDLRPDADPEALAQALLGAMQGGILLTQTTRRTEPLEASLAAALAYLRSFAATDPA